MSQCELLLKKKLVRHNIHSYCDIIRVFRKGSQGWLGLPAPNYEMRAVD